MMFGTQNYKESWHKQLYNWTSHVAQQEFNVAYLCNNTRLK